MKNFVFVAAVLVLGAPPLQGAEWELDALELSDVTINSSLGTSSHPVSVDADGVVHLVYQHNYEGDIFELVYRQRDGSGTWSPAEVISPPEVLARNASIAVGSDRRLYVVCEDVTIGAEGGDIGFRVREADGTWGPYSLIAPAAGFSRQPVATVDAFDRLHVVWIDGRYGYQAVLHVSQPPASAWDDPRILSTNGVTPDDPNLDSDGLGGVHVVWSDRGQTPQTRNSYDIVYLFLDPEAPAVINPVRLVDHSGLALRPFLEATTDGTMHLVWLDDRVPSASGALEIFYKRYLPDIGWGKDKRFTYNRMSHGNPVIAAGPAQTLHVVWEDFRVGNAEVYYREITDEFGWDPQPTRLTNDASASQTPVVTALPDGRLLMLWIDSQGSGTFRVFHRSGIIGIGLP